MLFYCFFFFSLVGKQGLMGIFLFALFCCVFILGHVVRLLRRKEIVKMLDLN